MIEDIKKEFPIFNHRQKLVYLDNAATTQKPAQVINAEREANEIYYASVHRGLYDSAEEATAKYEAVRQRIAVIMQASPEEILFSASATQSLNLAAHLAVADLREGDEILVSSSAHHSLYLPLLLKAQQKNAVIRWIELDTDFCLDLDDLGKKITDKTKIIALDYVSNVLGSIHPIKEAIAKAKEKGAKVILDAAQAVTLLPLSVKEFPADFIIFSSHKMYGPSGFAWMYASSSSYSADVLPLLVGGGSVIATNRKNIVWSEVPEKFEAGTPDVAAAIALDACLSFLEKLSFTAIKQHDKNLSDYMLENLASIENIKIFGPIEKTKRTGIFSFQVFAGEKPIHSHDVAQVCNDMQVAIRSGQHCAGPLMDSLGVTDLCRASFGIYNTTQDIDTLLAALRKAIKLFSK